MMMMMKSAFFVHQLRACCWGDHRSQIYFQGQSWCGRDDPLAEYLTLLLMDVTTLKLLHAGSGKTPQSGPNVHDLLPAVYRQLALSSNHIRWKNDWNELNKPRWQADLTICHVSIVFYRSKTNPFALKDAINVYCVCYVRLSKLLMWFELYCMGTLQSWTLADSRLDTVY